MEERHNFKYYFYYLNSQDGTLRDDRDYYFPLKDHLSTDQKKEGDDSRFIERFEIGLSAFTCNFAFYTINSTNNTLKFTENGGSELTITLDSGNPTWSALKTSIQSKLNSTGALTYTVTFDSSTYQLTFNVAESSSTVVFDFDNDAPCGKLLGFVNGESYSFTDSEPLESPNPLDLTYNTLDLDVILRNLTFSNCYTTYNGGSQGWGLIKRIVIRTIPFSTIEFQTQTPDFFEVTNSVIDSFTVELRDSDGKIIDLNGTDFSAVIVVKKVRERTKYSGKNF